MNYFVAKNYGLLRPGPSGNDGHGFDRNQPRLPAGHSDGGQWTSGSGSQRKGLDPLSTFAAARRRGVSEAFCLAQFTVDLLRCKSVPGLYGDGRFVVPRPCSGTATALRAARFRHLAIEASA